MKIRDIIPDFEPDSEINPKHIVALFQAVIQSGKTTPGISDYRACPRCGDVSLELFERRRNIAKGTILSCKTCKWEAIADEWEYLTEDEHKTLISLYGSLQSEKSQP